MIGEKVRELRKKLALTQKQFAVKIGKGSEYSYVGKVERGDQLPSIKFLAKIAEAHGVELGYFFQDGEKADVRALDLRRTKVKTLACLISRFDWPLADFRACRRACEQMPLCRVIRVLIARNGQSEK